MVWAVDDTVRQESTIACTQRVFSHDVYHIAEITEALGAANETQINLLGVSMEPTQPIPPAEFESAAGLEDWRVLSDGAYAFFRAESFGKSARLVAAVAGISGVDGHPPAVDVRHDGVTICLVTSTSEGYGMTTRDLEIARAISTEARNIGLEADPALVQSLLIIPGAPDVDGIRPFWRTLLGYEPRPDSPDEDLVDPRDRGTAVWLEQMDEPRPDGGGAIHVAVWVPREHAEARVQAALAAGGRLVRDAYAPSWWTLADAAGNEADVATIADRE